MKKQPKGFTMFFAALVGSLALAIGLSMYDITVRQIILASVMSQSQYAIYAADAGIECALYWDSKCTLSSCVDGMAFATPSSLSSVEFPPTPTTGVICNGFDIAAVGTPPSPYTGQPQASPDWTSWQLERTETAAITTFTFTMPSVSRCVQVTVAKYIYIDSFGFPKPKTVITSHGYNVCVVSSAQTPLERVLQVEIF